MTEFISNDIYFHTNNVHASIMSLYNSVLMYIIIRIIVLMTCM